MTDHLIAPHGGELVDLRVSSEWAEELRTASRDWPSWDLTDRQLCDLELLLNGSFSPLTGFMGQGDYESVRDQMRLADGTLWPMPITLDMSKEFAGELSEGDTIALRDPEGIMLAALHVGDIWEPDKEAEAEAVFGTANSQHPGVSYLMNRAGSVYLGGRVEGIQLPIHYDYARLRLTPAEVRNEFATRGWTQVVAFQTRNPMHRAHVELTRRAAAEQGANLLIHPVVGKPQSRPPNVTSRKTPGRSIYPEPVQ